MDPIILYNVYKFLDRYSQINLARAFMNDDAVEILFNVNSKHYNHFYCPICIINAYDEIICNRPRQFESIFKSKDINKIKSHISTHNSDIDIAHAVFADYKNAVLTKSDWARNEETSFAKSFVNLVMKKVEMGQGWITGTCSEKKQKMSVYKNFVDTLKS